MTGKAKLAKHEFAHSVKMYKEALSTLKRKMVNLRLLLVRDLINSEVFLRITQKHHPICINHFKFL